MKFALSGYGDRFQKTLALYSFNQNCLHKEWETAVQNPSFVCFGDGYLFTITETEDWAKVYCYGLVDGCYHLLNERELPGGSLCHITYSSKNKTLYGACYESGTIFAIQVKEGVFGEILHNEIQYGSDPTVPTRAHCVLVNRAENELITVNIALDQVCFYEIYQGRLTLSKVLEVPKGTGPRHCVLSKQEDYLYIITEYSNEILVYENMQEKKLLQRISTLSEDFTGSSNCSTLCFSTDYRYLYAANRGADTITLFRVEDNGLLTRRKEASCGGTHPRHMMISKDGQYLLICNQGSDNVAIYTLDRETGELGAMVSNLEFAAPSGVAEE